MLQMGKQALPIEAPCPTCHGQEEKVLECKPRLAALKLSRLKIRNRTQSFCISVLSRNEWLSK